MLTARSLLIRGMLGRSGGRRCRVSCSPSLFGESGRGPGDRVRIRSLPRWRRPAEAAATGAEEESGQPGRPEHDRTAVRRPSCTGSRWVACSRCCSPFAYGRVGRLGARATAALLAVGAFVTVNVVPFLIYPPNPPAVGNPDTIGRRTTLFFLVIVIAIGSALLAVRRPPARAVARQLERGPGRHLRLCGVPRHGALRSCPRSTRCPKASRPARCTSLRLAVAGHPVRLPGPPSACCSAADPTQFTRAGRSAATAVTTAERSSAATVRSGLASASLPLRAYLAGTSPPGRRCRTRAAGRSRRMAGGWRSPRRSPDRSCRRSTRRVLRLVAVDRVREHASPRPGRGRPPSGSRDGCPSSCQAPFRIVVRIGRRSGCAVSAVRGPGRHVEQTGERVGQVAPAVFAGGQFGVGEQAGGQPLLSPTGSRLTPTKTRWVLRSP